MNKVALRNNPSKNLIALIFFITFYLILFIQFPLKGSLPGNCDSLIAIAFSNTYLSNIKSFFSGKNIGVSMYPVDSIFPYGESSPFGGLIFIFYKMFIKSDIIAYYFFISTIFSLSAFGVYLLASLFVGPLSALCAGFAFTCSNLMFAHIDDNIVLFYFIPCITFYFLIRFVRENDDKYLYLSSLIGGTACYFSAYIFVYQSIILIFLFLYNILFNKTIFTPYLKRKLLKGFLLYSVVFLPFIIFYLHTFITKNIIQYADFRVIKMLGLQIFSPFFVLPNNLIFPEIDPGFYVNNYWMMSRYRTFIGISVILLAIFSLFKKDKIKFQLLLISLIGILLSFGPSIRIGENEYLTPLGYIYKTFHIITYLRVSIRAYFIFSLSISILAAMGIQRIINLIGKNRKLIPLAIVTLFLVIHFIENTPFPLKSFNMNDLVEIPKDYLSITKKLNNEIILDLPSSFRMKYINWNDKNFANPKDFIIKKKEQPKLFVEDDGNYLYDYGPLFKYNREIIYMNWQTKHKHNIVNGLNGYLPLTRLIYQYYIDKIPSEYALNWLKKQGITLIAFHKNMILKDETQQLKNLQNSNVIEKIYEGETTSFFRFKTD